MILRNSVLCLICHDEIVRIPPFLFSQVRATDGSPPNMITTDGAHGLPRMPRNSAHSVLVTTMGNGLELVFNVGMGCLNVGSLCSTRPVGTKRTLRPPVARQFPC